MADCFEYFIENGDAIQNFINAQSQFEGEEYQRNLARSRKPENLSPPESPPIEELPAWWLDFYAAIKIIREFTDSVEGDLMFQQDLWIAYAKADQQFNEIGETNKYAAKLHEFFTLRFVDTCNIDVAHLAYVLTAD